MPSYRFCILCAVLTALLALMLVAVGQPTAEAATERPVSFIDDVAPILKENCYACHDSKKKSGKLEMTSYSSLRVGGANEDPIVPGKPEDSELYNLVATDGARMMPPKDKGGPLAKEKVAIIERWIREGGKLDAGLDPKANILRELRKRWQPPTPHAAYPAPVMINAIAFSPDSKRIVTGGSFELNVWEATTGKLLSRIRTRSERAYGLAFLPDGLLAVAGGRPGQEGDVRVYDLAAAGTAGDGVKDPKVLVAHLFDTDDSVLCLAVSKDGQWLAAGGCDRAARVWDLSAGIRSAKLSATIETHADWVQGVAFGVDNKYLLTAGRDKTAKCYDLVKKEPILSFQEHQASVHAIVPRTDGKVAYSVGADKNLRFWKVDGDGKALKSIGGHSDEIIRVVGHPTQPFVVTASADKTVRIWREDGGAVKTLGGLSDTPFALAISPDGTTIAAGGYGGEVKVWRVPAGEVVATFNASPGLANATR